MLGKAVSPCTRAVPPPGLSAVTLRKADPDRQTAWCRLEALLAVETGRPLQRQPVRRGENRRASRPRPSVPRLGRRRLPRQRPRAPAPSRSAASPLRSVRPVPRPFAALARRGCVLPRQDTNVASVADGHVPCMDVRQPGRPNPDSVRRPAASREGTRRPLPGLNRESDLTGTVIRYAPEKTLTDGRGGPNG